MTGDDVEALIGEHVPGTDGYRFAALERALGDGVRVQIVDAKGDEIGWAAGPTKHDVIRDAKRQTSAHAARR
jgi:hypothetical protein